jgi:hypothetical protein
LGRPTSCAGGEARKAPKPNERQTTEYATAAALGNKSLSGLSEETFPALEKSSAGPAIETKSRDLLQEIPDLSIEDLESAVQSSFSKLSSKKLGGRISAADLTPLIHDESRSVVLPDSFKQADNAIGHYMLGCASMLGYKVKLIANPPSSQPADLSSREEQIGLGMFMSLQDGMNTFRFVSKKDAYEYGRTIVRAQQIVGFLTSVKLGIDMMLPNQEYFGNGIPDKDSKKKELEYVLKWLPSLFQEHWWGQQLTKVLVTLMRKSFVLADVDVLIDNMASYYIKYGDVVRRLCARDVVISPAQGKKKAQTIKRVPAKPRNNALFIKEELTLINKLAAPLWDPLEWEKLSHRDWVLYTLDEGLTEVRKVLNQVYNDRATFLSRMAALTTKRLRLIRDSIPEAKTKRKADVQVGDLGRMLLAKEDPYQSLAKEILSIDQSGDLFLKEHLLGAKYSDAQGDKTASMMSGLLKALVVEISNSAVYGPIAATIKSQNDVLAKLSASIREMQAQADAWQADLVNKYGAATIRKWKADGYKFDIDGFCKKQKLERRSKAEQDGNKKPFGPVPFSVKPRRLKQRDSDETSTLKELVGKRFKEMKNQAEKDGFSKTGSTAVALIDCWMAYQAVPSAFVTYSDTIERGISLTYSDSLVALCVALGGSRKDAVAE